MGKDLYTQAIDLIESMFQKCDPRLKGFCYTERRKDVYLAMPDVFKEVLIAALNKHMNTSDPFTNEARNTYAGIRIIQNHEMSIVLFHKDYPKVKESWMIYKVWLEAKAKPESFVVFTGSE